MLVVVGEGEYGNAREVGRGDNAHNGDVELGVGVVILGG